MTELVKVLINLTPEQKEWAKAQPGGMAAYIRRLIAEDMLKQEPFYIRAILEQQRKDKSDG